MSLILMDGFDDGLYGSKWTQVNAQALIAGRTGNAIVISRDDQYIRQIVAGADEHATFIVGAAINPHTTNFNQDRIIEFWSDSQSTLHLYVGLNTSRQLYVYRGNGTQLGITGTNVFDFNSWMYLEFKATLHDTTGSFTLRKDGATLLSGTGVDTKNGGTKTVFDSIKLRGTSGNADSSGAGIYVDDLYLLNGAGSTNNDLLGDVTIETLYPSGNGNYSQFVGSDADSTNNYQLVDEAGSPSTADYVGSPTDGNKDTYAYSNLTHSTGSVYGVAIRSYAAKSDAGAKSISNVVRSGGTDSVQTAQALSTSYGTISNLLEQNPVGATSWTIASVNAAEFGVQAAT